MSEDPICLDLLAGQNIDAGDLCLHIDGNNLLFTIDMQNDWQFSNAALWVSTEFGSVPMTNTGNPIPGQFPYKTFDHVDGTYQFAFPLDNSMCNNPLWYALHVDVFKTGSDGSYLSETAWSDGQRFVDKGNWATYNYVYIYCDCSSQPPPPQSEQCETAFARDDTDYDSSTCFIDDGFSRWGWTSGPLITTGDYSFALWAAAGQCDVTKGTLVGVVDVTYDGNALKINYSTFDNFTMEETHLYIGVDEYPKVKQGSKYVDTVAPGQYPYKHTNLDGVSEDGFVIDYDYSTYYIIAHAVVCGKY